MKHFAITEALRYELANLAGMLGKVELSQELMAAPCIVKEATTQAGGAMVEWVDVMVSAESIRKLLAQNGGYANDSGVAWESKCK